MMPRSALWLMVRPRRAAASEMLLPAVSSTVITVAALTVAVLAGQFWQEDGTGEAEQLGPYRILAVTMVILLVVPLSTLAASAARLSARRRDDRLATLRLLGASSRGTRAAAVAESLLSAALGAVAGTACHLASAPLVMHLSVRGATPQLGDVWMPAWVIASTAAAVLLLALLGAVTGLRQVLISPLGVRTRATAPRLSRMRVMIAALVLVGAAVVLQMLSGEWGLVGVTAAAGLAVTATMGVLGLAGPFVVARLAARRARKAQTAAELIAARSVQESPKTAWRAVSGVALASFLVVPTGSVLGYLDLIRRSSTAVDAETLRLFADVRTMMLTVVVISFLLVASSVGVTQSAAILERRDLYIGLDRIGMPVPEMNRARRLAVASPLRLAAFGAAASSALLGFWFVVTSLVMAPLFMLGVAATLTAGAAMVLGAVTATAPVLRGVLASPDRLL